MINTLFYTLNTVSSRLVVHTYDKYFILYIDYCK